MPDGPHVLLVEDDEPTRSAVGGNLRGHGYRVAEAGSVAEALRAWDADRPDIILLDLGLPDGDGSTLIRRVRQGRDDADPRPQRPRPRARQGGRAGRRRGRLRHEAVRAGRAAGADRRPLLRRAAGPAAATDGTIELGPDPARSREARRDGRRHAGRPHAARVRAAQDACSRTRAGSLTKRRLLRAVWGTAYADEGHYLHVYVSRLRRKLEAADPTARTRRLIVAEPGVGYRVAASE